MAIEVRRAECEADFCRLRALFVQYERDLPADLRHGDVPTVAALGQRYVKQNAAYLALSGEDAVGCAGVTSLDARSTVIEHVFVRPESRGLGAARALVSAAVAFAREGGFRRIVLDTNKERLAPAYLLYRSLGFEECEPYGPVSYECPTFMELDLAPRPGTMRRHSRRSDLNR